MNEDELLGAFTPLPMLIEEVLRYRFGLPVGSKRFRLFQQAIASFTIEEPCATEPRDDKRELLFATAKLLHGLPPPTARSNKDGIAEFSYAIRAFFHDEAISWYQEWLKNYQFKRIENTGLPSPLLLLVFIHGLYHQWLTQTDFNHCVLQGKLLSSAISPHRRLSYHNRLLDYLGLSQQPFFTCLYRELTNKVWPTANADNWIEWHWITQPGDPGLFTSAFDKITAGDFSLPRLYELKYSPLPSADWFATSFHQLPAALQKLLVLLRGENLLYMNDDSVDGYRWLRKSNIQAFQQACTQPRWWEPLLNNDFPILKSLLNDLQYLAIPVDANQRVAWLEKYLISDYQKICANLLMLSVAGGDDISAITSLVASGDIAAIHAMAFIPVISKTPLTLLNNTISTATVHASHAAQRTLNHLAHLLGLPDAAELLHQQLLNEAWNVSALDGERVRVGWQIGSYRIRIGLRRGQVLLDVIGPHGAMNSIPTAVRKSEVYRLAREAQREVQRQYRVFRNFLEQAMLSEQPIIAGEFNTLLANPIFAHLAERLIWQTADGNYYLWSASGKWETSEEELIAPADNAALTFCIAHPIHLAKHKILAKWQSLAADRRLIQPFKQLFREIYCYEDDMPVCRRFAGRKIDPIRAYALLRSSGFSPASGTATREWPGGYRSHICWAEGVRGSELFGPQRLPFVMCGDISFYQHDRLISPQTANPIIVSETLRATDLLTTRAAIGDAELTSNETVLLRATLLRELSRALSLTNLLVQEHGRYALVLGKRADYRINLSNGTILLEPEGRQIEAPQHEEFWQPTEDKDTTSTIIAIIITLAMDEMISDLTFIAQLS